MTTAGSEKGNELAEVTLGNAADLRLLRDGEADLVITSPPYFSSVTECLLRAPVQEQTEFLRVEKEVTAFAQTLRPAFNEVARVLALGGALVLQTKNIRYGGFLIPLADMHREIACAAGLRLVTTVYWLPGPRLGRKPGSFQQSPRVGTFRAAEVQEFSVLAHPVGIRRGAHLYLPARTRAIDLINPLWRLSPDRRRHRHPYGSPPAVVKRFIELFSKPGDLVVDPFAGYGTMLLEAKTLGRRALGCDLDEDCVAHAARFLGKKT